MKGFDLMKKIFMLSLCLLALSVLSGCGELWKTQSDGATVSLSGINKTYISAVGPSGNVNHPFLTLTFSNTSAYQAVGITGLATLTQAGTVVSTQSIAVASILPGKTDSASFIPPHITDHSDYDDVTVNITWTTQY